MSMWSRFKKWALKSEPLIESAEADHGKMVGEPVLSFIASLNRERGRRYVFVSIGAKDYTGKIYHWMSRQQFYQMTDKKTGAVYQLYLHDQRLYNIVGLPFSLNGWELAALFDAYMAYRQVTMTRYYRILTCRHARERVVKQVQEQIDRAAYAKQFQE